jgi:hypothetical protein
LSHYQLTFKGTELDPPEIVTEFCSIVKLS